VHSGLTSLVPDIPTPEEVQAKRAWVEARYPENIINKIAKAARLKDPGTIAAMKGFLIDVGLWYLDHKDLPDPSASLEPEREQLEAVAATAAKLTKLLQSMSETSAISLWHPFQHISLLALRSPPNFVTDFGLTVIQRPYGDDGAFVIEHLRPHQIEEAVRVLQQLATQAAQSLPKQRAGQRQFGPRQDWIRSAAHFWRNHSKLAFDPRSPAADFCHLALQQLDKSVTEAQIRSGIRAANAFFSAIAKQRLCAQKSS
jgi:hypothetical protein